MRSFYTVYKTTNCINGKTYIGKHKTRDLNDDYLGSGKMLKNAIKKYGKENFQKEILFVFNTEIEANQAEEMLVEMGPQSYNLKRGGEGGFDYILANGLNDNREFMKHLWTTDEFRAKMAAVLSTEEVREKISKASKRTHASGKLEKVYFQRGSAFQKTACQKAKTEECIAKRKKTYAKNKHSQGQNNSQYGSFWVTDGRTNKKISKNQQIPVGFSKGRIFNA